PLHPVLESDLEFLAQIPRRENAVGLVPSVGEPLFEFAPALGQHLRFLHVSEQAFVRASGGGQQRDGCQQAANATAVSPRYIAAQEFWDVQETLHPPYGHPLPSEGRGMG